MPFTMTVLTAFVYKDKNAEEGILAFLAETGMMMPMVFADEARAQSLYPKAKQMFPDTPFRIIQFSERKDVTEEWLGKFGEKIAEVGPDGEIHLK